MEPEDYAYVCIPLNIIPESIIDKYDLEKAVASFFKDVLEHISI
jgi:hypothetical protein